MADPIDMSRLERSRMSFGGHLEELRKRLGRAIVVTLAGMAGVFIFRVEVMEFITQPYRDVMLELYRRPVLSTLGVPDAFFGYLKVSLVVALILTAPFWIYQLWAFIGAGLYKTERRRVYAYAPFCMVLLAAGVAFGYLLLIPIGLRYLLSFGDPTQVQSAITLTEYLGFFTILTLVLGLAFQLPLVMVGLARAGLVGPDAFRQRRRWVILGIFVAAAVFTPPDVITQILLGFPLVGLYELGIFLSWIGQGSSRSKVDRAALWQRVRKVLILALVGALLYRPLVTARHHQVVDGRVYGEAQIGELPMMETLGRILDAEVSFAIRAAEEKGVALVLVRSSQGVALFEVPPPGWQSVQVLGNAAVRGPGRATVRFAPGGDPLFEFRRLGEVEVDRIVPGLLEALEWLTDEGEAAQVRTLLAEISGETPPGNDEEALAAFADWFAKHRDATWQPPR